MAKPKAPKKESKKPNCKTGKVKESKPKTVLEYVIDINTNLYKEHFISLDYSIWNKID